MKVRRSLLKDTVSVETYAGEGAYGPIYAEPVAVPCRVEATRRLVRNASGFEVVSESTLFVHPDDVATFTPESRLTFATRQSTVIVVKPQTFRGATSHGEVSCS